MGALQAGAERHEGGRGELPGQAGRRSAAATRAGDGGGGQRGGAALHPERGQDLQDLFLPGGAEPNNVSDQEILSIQANFLREAGYGKSDTIQRADLR